LLAGRLIGSINLLSELSGLRPDAHMGSSEKSPRRLPYLMTSCETQVHDELTDTNAIDPIQTPAQPAKTF